MPASEVECLAAWSQLTHNGHRIVFLGVKRVVRQLAARSKGDGLGWIPVFLNGTGPIGRFIPRQPRQQAADTIKQQAFLEVDLAEARVAGRPSDFIVASAEVLKKRERPYLQELLKETHAIYKNTWNEICKEPSPLFLRAVVRKVFRPLVLNLIEDPGKPSELCPHLPADFAPAYLVSLIGRLPVKRREDAVDYILDDLLEQIEAEVLKLESVAAPPRKEALLVAKRQSREAARNKGGSHTKKKNGQRSIEIGSEVDSFVQRYRDGLILLRKSKANHPTEKHRWKGELGQQGFSDNEIDALMISKKPESAACRIVSQKHEEMTLKTVQNHYSVFKNPNFATSRTSRTS